jgi:uncharacterized protein (TIGR02145 family)
MQTIQKIYYPALALMSAMLMIFISCEKDNNKSVPVLTTTIITGITQTTATSGGTITDDGGAIVSERGVCWSTKPNPTINDSKNIDDNGTESYSSSISGLEPNTTYYLKAYAINSEGKGYGAEKSFTTYNSDAISDIEGNFYNKVTIDNQEWLAGNLRTKTYNNGTPIATGHSNNEWESLSTGAYAVYPHSQIDGLSTEAEVLEVYGALYNWYAVNTGNLCPTGWRVPGDEDWTQLIQYIDPDADPDGSPESSIAGRKLKATIGWYNDGNGSDEFGFSALPGGGRDLFGSISHIGYSGFWWSSTGYNINNAWYRRMFCSDSDVLRDNYIKRLGLSVRCIKDN